jgi:hypothetical protein
VEHIGLVCDIIALFLGYEQIDKFKKEKRKQVYIVTEHMGEMEVEWIQKV